MKQETKSGSVQTLDRALSLLKMVANKKDGISITELCSDSGLNRTTVWRLLLSLEENGFIERDIVTKNYYLGYSATSLCVSVIDQYSPLIRLCRPVMRQICEETSESVLLTVPRYGGLLTIDQIDSPQAVCIKNYVDIVSPLYCSSNGKLLMSTLHPKELDLVLQSDFEKITSKTITDSDKLRQEIELTRKRGYGLIEGELDESENGISVEINDGKKPVAFLNVCGPSFRFTREIMESYAPVLLMLAAKISEKLKNLR